MILNVLAIVAIVAGAVLIATGTILLSSAGGVIVGLGATFVKKKKSG